MAWEEEKIARKQPRAEASEHDAQTNISNCSASVAFNALTARRAAHRLQQQERRVNFLDRARALTHRWNARIFSAPQAASILRARAGVRANIRGTERKKEGRKKKKSILSVA